MMRHLRLARLYLTSEIRLISLVEYEILPCKSFLQDIAAIVVLVFDRSVSCFKTIFERDDKRRKFVRNFLLMSRRLSLCL